MSPCLRLLIFLPLAVVSLVPVGAGTSRESTSGLKGKVMCGYQAWFRCPDDGTRLGWKHYSAQGEFAPAKCTIELWPDVRELSAHLRVKTPFRHPDGSVAEVYSALFLLVDIKSNLV
ncbi:MAG: hypothetical protein H7A51_06810 [Akkermansiaceae bacterium]|nr:hypothetical protein [Akkermansiaceae bacterium]